jgi:hypothetical protein
MPKQESNSIIVQVAACFRDDSQHQASTIMPFTRKVLPRYSMAIPMQSEVTNSRHVVAKHAVLPSSSNCEVIVMVLQ